MKIKIGLVDDHQLFLKSVSAMIHSFEQFEVVLEALSGDQLIDKLEMLTTSPDIIFIDVNMPGKDGIETTCLVTSKFPGIKLVALTMNDSDSSIIRMLKSGCCSYLLKDIHPAVLEKAINEIAVKGYYNADLPNKNLNKMLAGYEQEKNLKISGKEQQFLTLACSDLTYKEVAGLMNLSQRTIDGYRESLFVKFNVQSRVGLCLEAIRKGIVKL